MSRARTDRLLRAIAERRARVGVVGQGYVGLSLAAAGAVEGFDVVGVDVDADRVADLTAGRLVVAGVEEPAFLSAVDSGRLSFSTSVHDLAACDVVVICVPTPVVEHRPDLSMIEAATRALAPVLRKDALIVLESTTYPGTTEGVVQPILAAAGRRVGRDVWLAFSPERIDPGNVKYGLRNTPRVTGGVDAESTELAAAFYRTLVDDVTALSSTRTAEMAKLLENTFRMVNIALVNELAVICGEQGIDVWEVIRAASTKPFGFMAFQPGPGVGGHCIPLDPTYLAWQSRRDTGRPFRLVELAQDINAEMPGYVTRRIVDELGRRGVALRDARVFALGVTYKPDVGDLRESAAIETLERLQRAGVKVSFHDPYVDRIRTHAGTTRRSALTPANLSAADAVLVLTPHSSYDLERVRSSARLVFDARDALGVRGDESVVAL